MEAHLLWKCCYATICYMLIPCSHKPWIAWDILYVMSNMTGFSGNLCNKCPKWLVKQNSSYSDYFNVISGFTSNSRAPGGHYKITWLKHDTRTLWKLWRRHHECVLLWQMKSLFEGQQIVTLAGEILVHYFSRLTLFQLQYLVMLFYSSVS